MTKQSPTDTPAHKALEALAYEAHNSPMTDEELDAHTTTVRDLLLDGDEAAWLSGHLDSIQTIRPELYNAGKFRSIHAKAMKIAGFTS